MAWHADFDVDSSLLKIPDASCCESPEEAAGSATSTTSTAEFLYFKWFVSPRQGVNMSSMNNREKMIEKWTDGKTEQAHIQTIPPERRAGYREKTSSRVIGYHSGNNLKRRALRQSWGGDIVCYSFDTCRWQASDHS